MLHIISLYNVLLFQMKCGYAFLPCLPVRRVFSHDVMSFLIQRFGRGSEQGLKISSDTWLVLYIRKTKEQQGVSVIGINMEILYLVELESIRRQILNPYPSSPWNFREVLAKLLIISWKVRCIFSRLKIDATSRVYVRGQNKSSPTCAHIISIYMHIIYKISFPPPKIFTFN